MAILTTNQDILSKQFHDPHGPAIHAATANTNADAEDTVLNSNFVVAKAKHSFLA